LWNVIRQRVDSSLFLGEWIKEGKGRGGMGRVRGSWVGEGLVRELAKGGKIREGESFWKGMKENETLSFSRNVCNHLPSKISSYKRGKRRLFIPLRTYKNSRNCMDSKHK
jgi:hypothetical protein